MAATLRDTAAPTSSVRTGSWLPAFLLLALIWGTSFMFIKIGVAELPGIYVALGRIGLGAVMLLVVMAVLRRGLPRDPRLWLHLAGLAVFTNSVPFTLFGYAEERVSSILAGIWNGTAPLTTLVVTLIALPDERPNRQRIGGLLLGFAGVLVVLGVWDGVAGASLSGQLMLLGAVTCYGIGFNYTRWIMKRWAESPLSLSASQLSMSTLQLLVAAPLIAGAPPALASLSAGVVWSVVALGVLGTGLAFVLNFHVVRVAGVTTASTVTYLPPVVGAVAGVTLLGEHLAWNQPLGGLIVLAGVAVSQGLLRRRRRAATA
jgi:drug/metabolite transporter (DMT)-like permease